jgi:hypothetical protein
MSEAPARPQVPLEDELINAAAGPALRAAVDMRVAQVKRGHTREADADQPLHWLAAQARDRMAAAVDRTRGDSEARNLPAARLGALKAIGMALAFVDRLDTVIAAQAAKEAARG